MPSPSATLRCVRCDRPETSAALIALRFGGDPAWICSQCLPVLIHHPDQLADRLPGIDTTPARSPHDS